jgi:putative acetyltransferase
MQFQNYFLKAASNHEVYEIKSLVFSVLTEYGLLPDEWGKDADLNDLEQNYFMRQGYFGVAIESATNRIIGTFGLYRISTSVCELRKMYLLKEARGKGFGKFILENAVKRAKELHYEKLVLETFSSLKEAIALYKKFGFTAIKPETVNHRVDQAFVLDI